MADEGFAMLSVGIAILILGVPILGLAQESATPTAPSPRAQEPERVQCRPSPKARVLFGHAPHAFWNYEPWLEQSMDEAAAFILRVAGHGQGVHTLADP